MESLDVGVEVAAILVIAAVIIAIVYGYIYWNKGNDE